MRFRSAGDQDILVLPVFFYLRFQYSCSVRLIMDWMIVTVVHVETPRIGGGKIPPLLDKGGCCLAAVFPRQPRLGPGSCQIGEMMMIGR